MAPDTTTTLAVASSWRSHHASSRRGMTRPPMVSVHFPSPPPVIHTMTTDLKAEAREMERELYPDAEGPRPARVSGRIRPRSEGGEVVLGSVWAEGSCSVDGARASRHRP